MSLAWRGEALTRLAHSEVGHAQAAVPLHAQEQLQQLVLASAHSRHAGGLASWACTLSERVLCAQGDAVMDAGMALALHIENNELLARCSGQVPGAGTFYQCCTLIIEAARRDAIWLSNEGKMAEALELLGPARMAWVDKMVASASVADEQGDLDYPLAFYRCLEGCKEHLIAKGEIPRRGASHRQQIMQQVYAQRLTQKQRDELAAASLVAEIAAKLGIPPVQP